MPSAQKVCALISRASRHNTKFGEDSPRDSAVTCALRVSACLRLDLNSLLYLFTIISFFDIPDDITMRSAASEIRSSLQIPLPNPT